VTGGPYFNDDGKSDTTDINGKRKSSTDGVHRARDEKFPQAISQYTLSATHGRWLDALKTKQDRRPYPLPVEQRKLARVYFPIMWGRHFSKDWRPQTGWVDDTDYRGLGEGRRCVESCAVRPPPPIPQGQAPAVISYWNVLSKDRSRRGFDMQTTDEIVQRLSDAALPKYRGHKPSDVTAEALAKTYTRNPNGLTNAVRRNISIASQCA
jgi:hypothetical protein